MSFQDLERGLGERAPLARDVDISPEADLKFKSLARAVSIQIHKINANTSAINKLVELLGTPKDTPDLRNKLHNLTDATREVLKESTAELKQFANSDLTPADKQHRYEQQKVSNDFQKALTSFQSASKRSAEKQRLFVERAKNAIGSTSGNNSSSNPHSAGARTLGSGSQRGDYSRTSDPLLELEEQPSSSQQQQTQQLVDTVPDSEVDFQEQMIQEREDEIEQIEQGITELNQIFKDLGQIVGEQQSMIDNIETNVRSVATDTRGASSELIQAHAYQRRAGRRMFCLLITFLLVISIVLLAILS